MLGYCLKAFRDPGLIAPTDMMELLFIPEGLSDERRP